MVAYSKRGLSPDFQMSSALSSFGPPLGFSIAVIAAIMKGVFGPIV